MLGAYGIYYIEGEPIKIEDTRRQHSYVKSVMAHADHLMGPLEAPSLLAFHNATFLKLSEALLD